MTTKIKFDLPQEKSSIIKVIGVGGGGSNAVNHMYRQGIVGVDFFVCNTDAQALEMSPIPNKIQIGHELTEGRGAGSNPEVGKRSALESIEQIIELLGVNTKMIFVTAGMGGGTGTGAAPIIAKTAKELGILTVGIVTTPFTYEGPKRRAQAMEGMEELRNSVDSLLLISNDKIKDMYGKMPLSRAFANADNILATAAKGIAEIITVGGEINVDFEDVKTAMTNSGVAIMGNGMAEGENRAMKAAEMALNSPLLNENQIVGAKNILINISYGEEEVLMDEISEIMEYFQDQAGMNANLKWGHAHDSTLKKELSVTIIATGFETKENKMISEEPPVIVHKLNDEPIPVQSQVTLDLEVNPAVDHPAPVDHTEMEKKTSEVEYSAPQVKNTVSAEEEEAEKIQRMKERIRYLKDLNQTAINPQSSSDLDNVPAYMRKRVKLDEIPHSSESQISRYTLFEEPNKKPELKSNNSFLHDNVD